MGESSSSLRQVAALPLRYDEHHQPEVLLITSRETHRWVIPKGWPMAGLSDHKAAATEAEEEAGVTGKISARPLGTYLYWKRRETHFDLVEVTVFPLTVKRQLDKWREKAERVTQWFPVKDAIEQLQEPGLQAILLQVEQKALRAA